MDVASALTAINTSISLVGRLREITKNMQQAELKGVIADLANELAEAKLTVADLKVQIAALKEENRSLTAARDMRKPKVQWGCYVFEGDENLYCPACFDTKGKKHLTTRANSQMRVCSVCGSHLFSG